MLDSVRCPEKGVCRFFWWCWPRSENQYVWQENLFYCAVIVSLEVLIYGAWSDLKELEDSELIEFACRLPQTIIHSRAYSTINKYRGAFRRWKVWASQHSMPILPAKDYQITLYLRSLERSQSKSTVEEAYNVVAWVYSKAGLPTPTTSPFVKAMLEGM